MLSEAKRWLGPRARHHVRCSTRATATQGRRREARPDPGQQVRSAQTAAEASTVVQAPAARVVFFEVGPARRPPRMAQGERSLVLIRQLNTPLRNISGVCAGYVPCHTSGTASREGLGRSYRYGPLVGPPAWRCARKAIALRTRRARLTLVCLPTLRSTSAAPTTPASRCGGKKPI